MLKPNQSLASQRNVAGSQELSSQQLSAYISIIII